MKKIFYLLLIAGMIISSCQPKSKVTPVDLTAAKDDVAKLLDKFNAGLKGKDASAVIALFTDDCLACGTDPKEVLGKADWSAMLTQALADTTVDMNYTVDKTEIKISSDGNSAIAMEQAFLRSFSDRIPCRIIYHAVKNDTDWQLNFISFSFIPNNEDISKLNKALD
jgi:uncharacterized protein (TIGR02246 family)